MDDQPKRVALKQFLQARRAMVGPEELGIASVGRRAVRGLRREELAQAAGVGLTWYTWLEQGRSVHPSSDVLERISNVLRLDAGEREYLFTLAGQPLPNAQQPGKPLPPGTAEMIASFNGPAFVLDNMGNELATNDLARALYGDERVQPYPHNALWTFFQSPFRRSLYRDYERTAAHFVALFRMGSASLVGDATYTRFVADLETANPLFARLWQQHDAAPLAPHQVALQSPALGDLTITSQRLPLPGLPGGYVVLIVAADANTRAAFDNWIRANRQT